jgi:hypothetical protein
MKLRAVVSNMVWLHEIRILGRGSWLGTLERGEACRQEDRLVRDRRGRECPGDERTFRQARRRQSSRARKHTVSRA